MSTRAETPAHHIDAHAPRVTIRRLGRGDRPALARLAQLDSSPAPREPLLGAELDGRLLAAISIAGGELVADPFHRTAEVAEMLRLRASQLAGGAPRARGRLAFLLRSRGGRRGASFSPSPPGAERQLLAHQAGWR